MADLKLVEKWLRNLWKTIQITKPFDFDSFQKKIYVDIYGTLDEVSIILNDLQIVIWSREASMWLVSLQWT